jgi:hypothetical protein
MVQRDVGLSTVFEDKKGIFLFVLTKKIENFLLLYKCVVIFVVVEDINPLNKKK